jgi:Nucleotide modification associated domain 2/TIR domain
MTKYYSYVVPRDYGFAPNPFGKHCTLAASKPRIRERAQVGDWIIGTTSPTSHWKHPRLIYAMQVTKKITYDQYFYEPEYFYKKPVMNGSLKQMYGDNIYYQTGEIEGKSWVQLNSHHSNEDGTMNELNVSRDTSCEYVLISEKYYYFGQNAVLLPNQRIAEVCKKGPGFRILSSYIGESFIDFISNNIGCTVGCHGDPLHFNMFERYNSGTNELTKVKRREPKILVIHRNKSDEYINKTIKLLRANGFEPVISSTYDMKNFNIHELRNSIDIKLNDVSKVVFLISNKAFDILITDFYINIIKENNKPLLGVLIDEHIDHEFLGKLQSNGINIVNWSDKKIITALNGRSYGNSLLQDHSINSTIKDVYLCHAKEDNDLIVKPLIKAFELASISFWYDEFEVLWGDSLDLKIEEGLFASRFIIVILSESFLVKDWTITEMKLAKNKNKKILPVLHGNFKKIAIMSKSTLGLDIEKIKYLEWDGDPEPILSALKQIL